jgi:hypothetical protein
MLLIFKLHRSPLITTVAGLAFTIASAGCGPGRSKEITTGGISHTEEAWNANNDPRLLRAQFKTALADLPLTGKTRSRPWSDSYWPNFQGGLANRWNDPNYPDPFNYTLNDETNVRKMSSEQLSQLSPAEKYDIYMGNFEYPLVKMERSRTSADDPGWFGLCHGWAPASLNFAEPQPTVVKGPSGIDIPFGSSDIKALLTLAQQFGTNTRVMGERCNADLIANPEKGRDPACRDVNAGSFHIALTNLLGIAERGFVAEISRGQEVWNQPVYAFTSKIVDQSDEVPAGSAPGTVKIAHISTTMNYVAEIGAHWDNPLPVIDVADDPSVILEYSVELDATGMIIGGEWTTDDHPDFLWTQNTPHWFGYYTGIKKIYEASQGSEFFDELK